MEGPLTCTPRLLGRGDAPKVNIAPSTATFTLRSTTSLMRYGRSSRGEGGCVRGGAGTQGGGEWRQRTVRGGSTPRAVPADPPAIKLRSDRNVRWLGAASVGNVRLEGFGWRAHRRLAPAGCSSCCCARHTATIRRAARRGPAEGEATKGRPQALRLAQAAILAGRNDDVDTQVTIHSAMATAAARLVVGRRCRTAHAGWHHIMISATQSHCYYRGGGFLTEWLCSTTSSRTGKHI